MNQTKFNQKVKFFLFIKQKKHETIGFTTYRPRARIRASLRIVLKQKWSNHNQDRRGHVSHNTRHIHGGTTQTSLLSDTVKDKFTTSSSEIRAVLIQSSPHMDTRDAQHSDKPLTGLVARQGAFSARQVESLLAQYTHLQLVAQLRHIARSRPALTVYTCFARLLFLQVGDIVLFDERGDQSNDHRSVRV